MPQYRFLFLNDYGETWDSQVESLQDDLAALDEAKELCADVTVEVWQGNRHVAWVKEGDAPLDVSDSHSL